MMENHSSCSCKQEKEVLKLDSMPLAMTYVPWQKWQNIYKPETWHSLRQQSLQNQYNILNSADSCYSYNFGFGCCCGQN